MGSGCCVLLRKVLFFVFFLSSLTFQPAVAELNRGVDQANLDILFPNAVFEPGLPTLQGVTGIALGQRPLRPEEVVAYFTALAEASPRAQLIEYARSHEGRPLVILAISNPGTIADLEGFRVRHAKLLDPRVGGVPASEELVSEQAVAWLAYGIHGDELSSTDAAAAVAYRLVAGEDPEAQQLRENLLILIDPCENPDGRGRYLAQTRSFAHATANPDQEDLSHRAVWPWGRGNHYLFDMNRDWFTMTQPESARSFHIARWLPQMLVDSHEMGADATYLFPPPRHPFNPFLPPNTSTWEDTFSKDQAAALDQRGFPYYSGEWNEEFFPGYGSSWASYHGTIGILYEMSRTTGTLVRKKGGTVRTFAQAIEHHVASSIANLNSLSGGRRQILHDQISARQSAVDLEAQGQGRTKVGAWILVPDDRHPSRVSALAGLLADQGVEVQVLQGMGFKASGLRSARTGEKVELALPSGSLLVRLDQPAGYLARVLLDPHVPMETKFLQEEREYLEKQKGSRLYETTAWSLPLARGVAAYWSPKVPKGEWGPWTKPLTPKPIAVPDNFSSLIIAGAPDLTPRVLADLLAAEINVRVAKKPFRIAGQDFGRGSLVIRRESNEADLTTRLGSIVQRHGVTMVPVHTSRSSQGPDLGSRQFPVLVPPRVGVLTGMPVSTTDFGAVWHLLDQELDLRFSCLDVSRLRATDLSRYNVLVVPPVSGGPAMYRQVIGPGGMGKLRQWVRAGGTVIGFGGGARMLADQATELTVARLRRQSLMAHPSPVWGLTAVEAEAAGRIRATGLRVSLAAEPENQHQTVPRESFYDVAPVLGPGAAPFAEGHDQGKPLGGGPQALATWVAAVLPQGQSAPEEADLETVDVRLRRFMPQGAFLRVDLDPESWLNFGLADEATVWFGGKDTIIAESPVTVAALFPEIERLHLGGLLWPEAAGRIALTAYATREAVGRGQVILFAANPVFRRWMKDSERMFLNAVLLGPGLGTRWSTPW